MSIISKNRLLKTGKVLEFRYDSREIFRSHSDVESRVYEPFIQTLIAKASRLGIDEAEDYLREKVDDGLVPEEVGDRLVRLIGRYSRMR